jgi:hypothetical protein
MVHGRECTPEEKRAIQDMLDPTPLSVAQSQIVALQSKLYALERKVNDLINITGSFIELRGEHRERIMGQLKALIGT